MTNLTSKEIELLEEVVSHVTCEKIDFQENLEQYAEFGDYEQMVSPEALMSGLGWSKEKLGGVISSLSDKDILYLAEAKEYSLGCDCWYIAEINDVLKYL